MAYYAVHSTTAAAPSLALALRKISYTPTARLAVAYRLIPRYDDCYTPSCCDPARIQCAPHYDIRGIRPLGNAWYLDRLLMGGQVGDGLEHYRLEVERMVTRLTLEAETWAESGATKAGELPFPREPLRRGNYIAPADVEHALRIHRAA